MHGARNLYDIGGYIVTGHGGYGYHLKGVESYEQIIVVKCVWKL